MKSRVPEQPAQSRPGTVLIIGAGCQRLLLLGVVVLAFLLPQLLQATPFGFLQRFEDGDIASADAVNQNFARLQDLLLRVGSRCDEDAVLVGDFCVDRFEASVWGLPLGPFEEIQYGAGADDYPCRDDGQDCGNIFARSRAGVEPSRDVTWFQAQQACANAGKRLLTNAEWQQAVAGTPRERNDGSTTCNRALTQEESFVPTGSRSRCVSHSGVFDMVGNAGEWVDDWVQLGSSGCPGWGDFSDDSMCLSGADPTRLSPGAILRGGDFVFNSGPFNISALPPFVDDPFVGFRCARPAF